MDTVEALLRAPALVSASSADQAFDDRTTARVARGAAWLDEMRPGWERLIDLAALDLKDECRCVLGHVFADRVVGSWESGYGLLIDEHGIGWALLHGFLPEARAAERIRLVAELDEVWISLVKERFASGLLSDDAVAGRGEVCRGR